ncbi:MAG TPA: YbaN family protein [Acidimicrobiia bacterium]|nr:YbaN family protein [Acidimicrobiia bacterium]
MTESIQPVAAVQPVAKARSPIVRGIYFVLGLICLGFAYLSFLPGIPTFDFVILAAFFFARSSDKFHNWLMNHRVFGKMIHAYRGGLTVRTKIIACVGIVASISFSAIVLVDNTILRTIMALAALYGIWFVLSRPTRREPSSTADVEPA